METLAFFLTQQLFHPLILLLSLQQQLQLFRLLLDEVVEVLSPKILVQVAISPLLTTTKPVEPLQT
jgi:hypothetical protein